MAVYWITYRDVEYHEPRKVFEVTSGSPAVKNQTILAQAGAKPVHVRWHIRAIGQDILYLVTYTHERLKAPEIKVLLDQAYSFAQERN